MSKQTIIFSVGFVELFVHSGLHHDSGVCFVRVCVVRCSGREHADAAFVEGSCWDWPWAAPSLLSLRSSHNYN